MSAEPNEAADDELDPDEPRTPLWLPLLGLGLFLLATMYVLVSGDDEDVDVDAEAAPAGTEQAEDDPHAGHDHPPGQHPTGK